MILAEKLEARGDIVRDVDGYFVFWPVGSTGGALSEHDLRELAEYLHAKNAAWRIWKSDELRHE